MIFWFIFPPADSNSSCGVTSLYECIVIDSSTDIDGSPVITLTASGSPRIAYFDTSEDKLMYAYPQNLLIYHPNCGPGGDTWRCIMISEGVSDATIVPQMAMDMGSAAPQIAYAYISSGLLPQKLLMHAKFVGSGGNCGQDYRIANPLPVLDFRWECDTAAVIDEQSPYIYTSFSIQVDPQDYAVISYAYVSGSDTCLGVTYPSERIRRH